MNCGASLVKIPTDKVLFGWIKYKYRSGSGTNSRKPYNQALHAELATEDKASPIVDSILRNSAMVSVLIDPISTT